MRTLLVLLLILPSSFCFSSDSLLINELMTSNRQTLMDRDGDFPDWVELVNCSANPVSLEGWSITDDSSKTHAWRFPSLVLEGGERCLIFLSGKNRKNEIELHTDFRIANGLEPLYLLDNRGNIIDFHPAVCIPSDLASGRNPDGSGSWVYLEPTPGKSNGTAQEVPFELQPDTVLLSLPPGYYEGDQWLELHHYSGNPLYYTLDGTEPDEGSIPYTGPIPLHGLETDREPLAMIPTSKKWREPESLASPFPVIRARVLQKGCPASSTVTASYLMNKRDQEECAVPVISLVCDPDDLFDPDEGIYIRGNHENFSQRGRNWERKVHFSLFEPGGQPGISMDAGMRIHGAGSRAAPQKSLRLYARDEYGSSTFSYPFFKDRPDLNNFQTILIKSVRDWSGTLFLEEMTHRLAQPMEMESMPGQTVIVYINGEYWGIHSLRERQDKAFLKSHYSLEDATIDIVSHKRRQQPVAEEGDLMSYQELLSFLESEDLAGEQGFSMICEKIDINSITDYYIAELYFANRDWPQNNYEMWKERDPSGKWRWMFFDCDGCMIYTKYDHLSEYLAPDGTLEVHEEWALQLLRRLMVNKEFREHFSCRFYFHLSHTFDPSLVLREIDRYESLYETLVPAHIERWNRPNEMLKWKQNVKEIRLFALQRPLELVRQLQKNFGAGLQIFPNPGRGLIQIRHPHGGIREVQLTVRSVRGTELCSSVVTLNEEGSCEMDLSARLDPGIYFLTLNDGFFQFTAKYILIP